MEVVICVYMPLKHSPQQKADRSPVSLVNYTRVTLQKTVVAPTTSPAATTRKKDESSSSEESDSEDETPAKPAAGVQ